MSTNNKKALELNLRDAMDGLEAFASQFAYRRLPEDLEILGIGDDAPSPCPDVQETPSPLPSPPAQVIQLADFRPARRTESPNETALASPSQKKA